MSRHPHHSEVSDRHVVARAREGREDAYREFVSRYRITVFNTIYEKVDNHEVTEDLMQETFVKAFGATSRS